ncbi:MAG: hypothetical protein OXG92_00235 [Chloroflexi bacterium]|nr:hypothetical protein [Chloroflexota bacterium]MCY3581766.1 hypothetical protein [Chloroflexota bacterium]MCY3714882.1 hypothetical protein [Chloroflexota bacterium]MDE2649182.1 hypothetical protein [Chloroflexota bacterium]
MATVESDALSISRRLSTLEEKSKSHSTKEDLANMKAELIKWFVGTQIALAALIIYLLQ